MHHIDGRVNFEPIQAMEAAMTKTRVQRSWGIKVGYLVLGEDGVHFYHRKSPEHFFVAYDDIAEMDLISKRRMMLMTPDGPRFFEVHKDYVHSLLREISSRTAPGTDSA